MPQQIHVRAQIPFPPLGRQASVPIDDPLRITHLLTQPAGDGSTLRGASLRAFALRVAGRLAKHMGEERRVRLSPQQPEPQLCPVIVLGAPHPCRSPPPVSRSTLVEVVELRLREGLRLRWAGFRRSVVPLPQHLPEPVVLSFATTFLPPVPLLRQVAVDAGQLLKGMQKIWPARGAVRASRPCDASGRCDLDRCRLSFARG